MFDSFHQAFKGDDEEDEVAQVTKATEKVQLSGDAKPKDKEEVVTYVFIHYLCMNIVKNFKPCSKYS